MSSSNGNCAPSSRGREPAAKTPANEKTRDFFCKDRSMNGSKRSPVSPSRITRLQEKEEMQNLNDRLVIYIETVRRLESENMRLKSEVQSYTEVSTRDVSEIKTLYERELEDAKRLIDELARDKAKFEIEVNKHKANSLEAVDKFERRYQNKYLVSDSNVKRSQQQVSSLREELATYKIKNEEIELDIKNYVIKIASLESRLREMEDKLRKATAKYETDLIEKDKEIDSSRKELSTLLLDYQELYDIKIGLDMEIEAYRKLLESEEKRLNISNYSMSMHNSYLNESALIASSTAAAAVASSTRSGKKRKVNSVEDEQLGGLHNTSAYEQSHATQIGVEICEHDFEGKSVRLTNTTDKDINIGGWQLRRTADSLNTDYKFPKGTQLKTGQSVAVCSSNAAELAQPDDLVMSGKQWCTGDKIITALFDKDNTVRILTILLVNFCVLKRVVGF